MPGRPSRQQTDAFGNRAPSAPAAAGAMDVDYIETAAFADAPLGSQWFAWAWPAPGRLTGIARWSYELDGDRCGIALATLRVEQDTRLVAWEQVPDRDDPQECIDAADHDTVPVTPELLALARDPRDAVPFAPHTVPYNARRIDLRLERAEGELPFDPARVTAAVVAEPDLEDFQAVARAGARGQQLPEGADEPAYVLLAGDDGGLLHASRESPQAQRPGPYAYKPSIFFTFAFACIVLVVSALLLGAC